jgi:hypothetical protein
LTSNGSAAGTWAVFAASERNAGCAYSNTTISPYSNNSKIAFSTLVYDNLNQFTTGTGTFTAKNTGMYTVSVAVTLNAPTTTPGVGMYIVTSNNSYALYYQQIFSGNNQYYMMKGTIDVPLTAGQNFYLQFATTGAAIGIIALDTWFYITITKS